MPSHSLLPGLVRRQRMKDRCSNLALAFNGQANDGRLLDGSAGRFVRRSDHEIRESASLNFGGAFEPHHNLDRQVSFQASGGWGLQFHDLRYGILPYQQSPPLSYLEIRGSLDLFPGGIFGRHF